MISLRQLDLLNTTAAPRLRGFSLPYSKEPTNRPSWVDIVDSAPIPLAFDLRATRHRQMIEQVRQRVFLTVESYYLCPAEPRLPLALAASNLNRRTGLVCEPIMGFLSRLPTITIVEAARPPPYPGAGISQNVSPPMFGRGLL